MSSRWSRGCLELGLRGGARPQRGAARHEGGGLEVRGPRGDRPRRQGRRDPRQQGHQEGGRVFWIFTKIYRKKKRVGGLSRGGQKLFHNVKHEDEKLRSMDLFTL